MDMQENDSAPDVITESRSIHGKSSYYHSDKRVSDKDRELLKDAVLLSNIEGVPVKLAQEQTKVEGKTIEINKYEFMNDGIWMKVIIETSNNSAFKDLKEENLSCEFGSNSFKLTITPAENINKYVLWMPRTRENIIAEKCKFYIRKTKIFVALYKEKEQDWWTLKGFKNDLRFLHPEIFHPSLKRFDDSLSSRHIMDLGEELKDLRKNNSSNLNQKLLKNLEQKI